MSNREQTELKDDLLKAIRERITIPGKVPSLLENLNNQDLMGLFTLLRQGSTISEAARFLIDRGAYTGNVSACRPLVERFKKKCLPLLVGTGKAPTPAPASQEPIPESLDELENINRLCKRYRALIDRGLLESEGSGALSQNLSKHVSSLNHLLKTKSKLETEQQKRSRNQQVGYSDKLSPAEEGRRDIKFKEVLAGFKDGGAVMVAATRKFLELAEPECVTINDEDLD